MSWKCCSAQALTAENLEALFDNEIPAIRIGHFADPEEGRAFANGMRKRNLRFVQGVTERSSASFSSQRIGYIGLTQFEYKHRQIGDYLDAAERSTAEVREVFNESFDPVQRLIDKLRAELGQRVDIGTANGRLYSHTIIRNSNEGLALHADFAPYQAPTLSVSSANAQLAWNFYAEVPEESGGETTIYNSPWTWRPSVEGEVAENYPLDESLVEGAEKFIFAPSEGEVVMFNSRNPHRVSPVVNPRTKDRIAMATFIGRMPDRELVLWS